MIVHAVVDHKGNACTANRSRCKHSRTAEDSRKRDRQLAALDMLQQDCPRHEYNKYLPQVIPEGIKLWYHQIGIDKLYPLEVTKHTVHAVCGPVAEHVPIYVVPDEKGVDPANLAASFAQSLAKWGYTNVSIKKVGFVEAFIAERPKPEPAKV